MSRILALSLHLPITVKSSSSSLNIPTSGFKGTTSTASSPAITPSYLFGHSGGGGSGGGSSGGSGSSGGGDAEEDYFSFLPHTAEIRREKKFVKSTQSNGGLHKALSSLGEEVWRIGYLGDTVNTDLSNLARQSYHCIPVNLSKKAYQVGYVKFCKQVLWPVLHYNVPDYPKGDGWDLEAWQGYVELNKQFLEVLCLEYQPGDVVWINDYHLMLLPRLFRERFPNAKIAFFLHVPFPSSELFRCLHVRKELLEGVLGAGLIGFQTFSYARHFLQTCVRVLRAETTPTSVKLDDHIVSVGIYPIGVDVGLLDLAQKSPAVLSAISILREKYQGQHLIVGKDIQD